MRLIALVDAHAQLSNPRITEKIGQTMSELAEGRDAERAGWEALRDRARDDRQTLAATVIDAAPELLTPELLPLFSRSVDPMAVM